MMYSYPFFSFPHFRKYPYYSSYSQKAPFSSQNAMNQYPTSYTVHRSTPHLSSSKINIRNEEREKNTITPSENNNLKDNLNHRKEKINSGKPYTGFSFLNNFLHQEDRSEEDELFEIFGLKLYYDDILLIGLIFFLYQEEVKDPYLFISLVLLLLS